jgi:uncharacterized protein YrrD
MFEVELKEGTNVFTTDGKDVGKIHGFVLEPETNEMTHIIVQKGWLLSEDKVVPLDKVDTVTEDKVVLSDQIHDFDDLPPFEETYYVRANGAGLNNIRETGNYPTYATAPAYYWYPPNGYLGFPAYGLPYYAWPPTQTVQNIPPDTVPIQEQTNVISSDGKHVGDVERIFLDPQTDRVTHFLISQGLLFKEHKLVPANWIKSADDEVRLKVSSEVLERLPDYES